jgi:predicted nucleotidyltransferase
MAKKTARPWRITRTAIAKLARQIVERFQPDRIILFGSHAYGEPDGDSDVDLLVIMPAKNMVNQAAKIRLALDYDFPLDLIVRTPEYLQERLKMDDWFVREILSRGKVLYEKGHTGMDAKGRIRLSRRETDRQHEADAHR